MKTRTYITLAILATFLVISVGIYFYRPLYIAYKLPALQRDKERRILYDYDHQMLAERLRKFAFEQKWNKSTNSAGEMIFRGDDPSIPVVLRGLGPSQIRVTDDRVDFDCGGPGLDYGISVFREGSSGSGTKELGPGVWFYSQDNAVPRR